jgi:hypothetical protein
LSNTAIPCRSELARDGLEADAFHEDARVTVNQHLEQARSNKGLSTPAGLDGRLKTRNPRDRNFFEIKGLPASVNQYIIHAIESTDRRKSSMFSRS